MASKRETAGSPARGQPGASLGAHNSNDQSISLQQFPIRSYASVVARGTIGTESKSERKYPVRPHASIVQARTTGTETRSEQKQPIGPIERSRLQRVKKPEYYYWPSWRRFPVVEELSAPSQPPTQDPGIPEIIVSEPANSQLLSSPRAPRKRMDISRLFPRAAPWRKRTRKASDGNGKASVPWVNRSSELAPKPSIFSYNLCTHPRCPIPWAHDRGHFFHGKGDRYMLEMNRKQPQSPMPFGPTNPPPEIWDAWDRVMGAEGGSVQDMEMVGGFKAAHLEAVRVEEDDSDGSDDMEFDDEDFDDLEFEDEDFDDLDLE